MHEFLTDFSMALNRPSYRGLTLSFALTLSSICTLSAETLESKNPFLPPGYGKEAPVQKVEPVVQNGPISREVEFRGIVQLDGVYQFSVFNKSSQKGYWLRENESEDGISIRSFDAESMSITLQMNGRSERLTLMSESDAPLPVSTSVSITQPNNTNANIPTPPNLGITNNSNNSEDRRRVIPRRRVILPKK